MHTKQSPKDGGQLSTINCQLSNVVTRFAPSPTGFMHVGGVRTALFAYLLARKCDGTFILRIEDTDRAREVAGSIEHIKESLSWFGIEWDESIGKGSESGLYLQSEHLEIYHRYARELAEKGFAYPDTYTPEEVEALRKEAEESQKPFLYRDHRTETFAEWDGKAPLRFKVQELKRTEWHDLVRGDLSAGVEALDDIILIKGDGYPTYNFAHIIDDIEMGVTHVLRGEEFISSMPKYLALYKALGEKPPLFGTLPPIMGPGGNKKLSKRDGAKDVLNYREDGYLPSALMNFVATLGWSPQSGGKDISKEEEIMDKEELVRAFSIEAIQKGGATWNMDKLNWMNKEHLKRLAPKELAERIAPFLPTVISAWKEEHPDRFSTFLKMLLERITVFSDVRAMHDAGELDFLTTRPTLIPEKLKTTEYLPDVIERLQTISDSDFRIEQIKTALWDFATEKGRGEVLWPMRYALTGKEKSPDPFTVAELLGKEEALVRIKSAI